MSWKLAIDRRCGRAIERLEERMVGKVRRLGLRVLVRPGYCCISSAVVFTIGEMNLRIFNTPRVKARVKCAHLFKLKIPRSFDLQRNVALISMP